MATVLAEAATLAEKLALLGDVPLDRVRLRRFGEATPADLEAERKAGAKLCELVDGVLVEKAMGTRESYLGGVIHRLLGNYVEPRKLGFVWPGDGPFELGEALVRSPDVCFVARERLPAGPLPQTFAAAVAPNLAVEVLSPSNTKGEMARKRRDYFAAGVELVWEVDPRARQITVYEPQGEPQVLAAGDILTGGGVLPGFAVAVADLFAALDALGG